jgi:hypothetical protein
MGLLLVNERGAVGCGRTGFVEKSCDAPLRLAALGLLELLLGVRYRAIGIGRSRTKSLGQDLAVLARELGECARDPAAARADVVFAE